jgi:hypothetical protein
MKLNPVRQVAGGALCIVPDLAGITLQGEPQVVEDLLEVHAARIVP